MKIHSRILMSLLLVSLLSACGSDEKKEEKKSYTIGVIMANPAVVETWDGFKAEMTDRGYVEGQNVTYYKAERDDLLTQQVSASDLDLILVVFGSFGEGPENSLSQGNAVSGGNIPVVVAMGGGDPVASGDAESVTRPGKNITGILMVDADVKRFELFTQILRPGAQSVAAPTGDDLWPVALRRGQTIRAPG